MKKDIFTLVLFATLFLLVAPLWGDQGCDEVFTTKTLYKGDAARSIQKVEPSLAKSAITLPFRIKQKPQMTPAEVITHYNELIANEKKGLLLAFKFSNDVLKNIRVRLDKIKKSLRQPNPPTKDEVNPELKTLKELHDLFSQINRSLDDEVGKRISIVSGTLEHGEAASLKFDASSHTQERKTNRIATSKLFGDIRELLAKLAQPAIEVEVKPILTLLEYPAAKTLSAEALDAIIFFSPKDDTEPVSLRSLIDDFNARVGSPERARRRTAFFLSDTMRVLYHSISVLEKDGLLNKPEALRKLYVIEAAYLMFYEPSKNLNQKLRAEKKHYRAQIQKIMASVSGNLNKSEHPKKFAECNKFQRLTRATNALIINPLLDTLKWFKKLESAIEEARNKINARP